MNSKNSATLLNASIIILSCLVTACSNRYVLYPNNQMNLRTGDKVKISTVTDSVYRDQVMKEDRDSIICAKKAFRKDEISKVEKKEISVPKTIGLVTGISAGIVVLPYFIILVGVATGVIPFDN